MESKERREAIRKILKESSTAVSASKLSEMLGVSRQIIVGDVALLRAAGCAIDATPRGYRLQRTEAVSSGAERVLLVCRHEAGRTEEELNILVDNGCRVLDVIVEHPVYGQLTGLLAISSRYDVKNFMKRVEMSAAHSLCELTNGLHIHTVEYTDEDAYRRALEELDAAGILFKE